MGLTQLPTAQIEKELKEMPGWAIVEENYARNFNLMILFKPLDL